MSAEQALFDAYREWRRITVAAGRAIQRRNWEFLRECQDFIQKLQPQISRLTLSARREWGQSRAGAAAKEAKIREVITELMELGERNQEWLKAASAAAQIERERLELAGHNLKRVQQSYTITRPVGWTSFS
jgi:hypothetical protein